MSTYHETRPGGPPIYENSFKARPPQGIMPGYGGRTNASPLKRSNSPARDMNAPPYENSFLYGHP